MWREVFSRTVLIILSINMIRFMEPLEVLIIYRQIRGGKHS